MPIPVPEDAAEVAAERGTPDAEASEPLVQEQVEAQVEEQAEADDEMVATDDLPPTDLVDAPEPILDEIDFTVIEADEPDAAYDDDIAELGVSTIPHVGDYGIDAPHIVGGIAWLAVIALVVTIVAGIINQHLLMFSAFAGTAVFTLVALTFVRSSRVGKVRERGRIVDLLDIDGSERVLDVGCGRGLLVVEMASRMYTPDAIAIGVDLWRHPEGSKSHVDAVFENAAIEGVDGLVDVSSADARALPYPPNCFDAVASSMTLHNIHSFEGRLGAIREIDRVTAPGGRAVIVDFRHTRAYEQALRSCNWIDVTRSKLSWRMFPPVRYVTGTKSDDGEGHRRVHTLTIEWRRDPVVLPSVLDADEDADDEPDEDVEDGAEASDEPVAEASDEEPRDESSAETDDEPEKDADGDTEEQSDEESEDPDV